jgi:hypothetical protein
MKVRGCARTIAVATSSTHPHLWQYWFESGFGAAHFRQLFKIDLTRAAKPLPAPNHGIAGEPGMQYRAPRQVLGRFAGARASIPPRIRSAPPQLPGLDLAEQLADRQGVDAILAAVSLCTAVDEDTADDPRHLRHGAQPAQ